MASSDEYQQRQYFEPKQGFATKEDFMELMSLLEKQAPLQKFVYVTSYRGEQIIRDTMNEIIKTKKWK